MYLVVVLHVVSSVDSGNSSSQQFYFDTKIKVRKRLLRVAVECKSIKPFVYSSTSRYLKGDNYDMDDKIWPMKNAKDCTTIWRAAGDRSPSHKIRIIAV